MLLRFGTKNAIFIGFAAAAVAPQSAQGWRLVPGALVGAGSAAGASVAGAFVGSGAFAGFKALVSTGSAVGASVAGTFIGSRRGWRS